MKYCFCDGLTVILFSSFSKFAAYTQAFMNFGCRWEEVRGLFLAQSQHECVLFSELATITKPLCY